MTAGDIGAVGFSANIETLEIDLTAAGVSLVGKPGELLIIQGDGTAIQWVNIIQA